jgi:hypothetical protein
MAGGRNGKPFRNALHDTEEYGFDDFEHRLLLSND